jgi:hypothetical protein
VVGDEALFFALVEGVKFGAVDGSHGSRKPKTEKAATIRQSYITHRREIPRLRGPTFRRSGMKENASACSARNDSTRRHFSKTIHDNISQ